MLTIPIASPRMYTSAWSDMVRGFVRKKKPSVMWKREMEVKMVLEDMSAMFVGMRRCDAANRDVFWGVCGVWVRTNGCRARPRRRGSSSRCRLESCVSCGWLRGQVDELAHLMKETEGQLVCQDQHIPVKTSMMSLADGRAGPLAYVVPRQG